jgi:hypothetical protein
MLPKNKKLLKTQKKANFEGLFVWFFKISKKGV